jgi:hypothetical protein
MNFRPGHRGVPISIPEIEERENVRRGHRGKEDIFLAF